MNFQSYPLNEYPEIADEEVEFPQFLDIAFAVCSKECGNMEFLVDGSSQVCQNCGKLMFRTVTKRYQIRRLSI